MAPIVKMSTSLDWNFFDKIESILSKSAQKIENVDELNSFNLANNKDVDPSSLATRTSRKYTITNSKESHKTSQ
jgi:hypothetical protein